MKKRIHLLLYMLLLAPLARATDLTIDINNASLNGVALRTATIDTVTDVLGRPTALLEAVESTDPYAKHPPRLIYADKGLIVEFFPNQTAVTVFFTSHVDKTLGFTFSAFRDKIKPDIGANTKAKQIFEIYSNAREMVTEGISEQRYGHIEVTRRAGPLVLVDEDKTSFAAYFDYDLKTTFLERMSLIGPPR